MNMNIVIADTSRNSNCDTFFAQDWVDWSQVPVNTNQCWSIPCQGEEGGEYGYASLKRAATKSFEAWKAQSESRKGMKISTKHQGTRYDSNDPTKKVRVGGNCNIFLTDSNATSDAA